MPGLGRFQMPGATKLMHHNYWAHPRRASELQLLKSARLESVLHSNRSHRKKAVRDPQLESSPRSPQLKKGLTQQQRPSAAE